MARTVLDAKEKRSKALRLAVSKARTKVKPAKNYRYEIKKPELMKGVIPQGKEAPVLAMDSVYDYARSVFAYGDSDFIGFPGYPYLAALSTRAEYRMFAQTSAVELTREWIVLNSTDTAGDDTKRKITEITQDLEALGLKTCIHKMAEHDSYYGAAYLLLDIVGHDLEQMLLLSPKTIQKKPFEDGTSITKYFRIATVEPMWITPSSYNAINPAAPDFYKPSGFFMLGNQVHATRLRSVVTREVADMLKPAFNFGGMSMSQLAEPYVDNWLRTRQSVANLISNFSITALKTSMDQALQSGDEQDHSGDLNARAELFALLRDNQGLMLLDKDREDLVQVNTPLSGLSELQAQAQEQLCSVSHQSSVKLLGIAPAGFGNVAEGELKAGNDWTSAQQEAYWRAPIETVIQIVQIIRYGMIDPDITFSFQPLYQMTPKEDGEIRKADADRDAFYVQNGILNTIEVREKLARDPQSGYQGIDITTVPDAQETTENLEEEDVP